MPGAGLSLTTSLKQTQTLAPQLRQALKFLQLGVMDLNQEVRAQMERNPAIERVDGVREATLSSLEPRDEDPFDGRAGDFDDEALESMPPTEREMDFTPGGLVADAALADSPDRDYYLSGLENADHYDEDAAARRRHFFDSQTRPETLQDHLISQIRLAGIPPEDQRLAEDLVGHLDPRGFFTGSVPDVAMVWQFPESRVRRALAFIRTLDPLGCGAETARECLLAQMEKLDDSPWEDEVRAIIDRHLEDLAAGRVKPIAARLGLTLDELAAAVRELRTLNPAPGLAYPSAAERTEYVEPEVFVERRGGRYVAVVPAAGVPRVRISERFRRMAEDPSNPEAQAYARDRLRAAAALIEALDRRQETIRAIAQVICDEQGGYFDRGPSAFRPLKMQEVARRVGVHEATVSRTVNDKYMRTPQGVKRMRFFFGSGVATESGETSAVAVKARIAAMVSAEDRAAPLSDDRIAAALAGEGVKISRRTVAKYRAAMKIPGAAERRRVLP